MLKIIDPVPFISSIGKTLEKLVHKHVHNFPLEHQIVTPFQSGFTSGDSTVNQLVDLYNIPSARPWMRERKYVLFFVI